MSMKEKLIKMALDELILGLRLASRRPIIKYIIRIVLKIISLDIFILFLIYFTLILLTFVRIQE